MKHETEKGVRKLPTGIEGLDRLLHGGLPDARMSLIVGNAGAGKSVLSFQILLHAAEQGMPGLVVGFEETAREIRQNLAAFDWDLEAQLDNKLHLMEAPVIDEVFDAEGFDIGGLLASVEARVEQVGARWVVFDGLDALLRTLGGRAAGLRELLRLRRWISRLQVATMITAKEDDPESDYAREFGFLPFMADCVVHLRNVRSENVFVRTLRVTKHRGGPCAGSEVSFVIDGRGFSVAQTDHRRPEQDVSTERVSTGIARLDNLIGGGYLRGSSILVSGSPGTAKTTLAGALAESSCKRGEKTIFISFDEAGAQIVRNMQSVGIDLQPHINAGQLHLQGLRASNVSAEEHLLEIQRLILREKPGVLVVDPISALAKAGGHRLATDVTERMLDFAKARGMTVLMTTLLEDLEPEHEGTDSQVSTIADIWIALTYNVRAGERNRALTVIKARGTQHSNQVRELVLSADGPTLTDVYTAGGEVLMGTARIEREAQERREEARRAAVYAREHATARGQIEDLENRLRALSDELKTRVAGLAELEIEENAYHQRRSDENDNVLGSRNAGRDSYQCKI